MRLLLDTCVWGGAVEELRDAGHDVVWTGDWSSDPGDGPILAYAHENHRILVTLDKDFGERAIVMGEPHAGIIRLVGIAARSQGAATIEVLDRHGEELVQGAIVTVGPQKIRIRPG
ncbi:MAG: toxin-antitoxin system, toxin component, PIN family protein [Wenzhouxiangella sp.]|nr:MAG: toxin-antitoxin system, toxin component, PIN family protein [Wenzhouxiangella sp.]